MFDLDLFVLVQYPIFIWKFQELDYLCLADFLQQFHGSEGNFRLEYCSSQSTCSVIPLSFSFKEETSPRSSSISFFCSSHSFSNSSNLSDINFIDSLRLANCFSPLIWLLLLESANLCISLSSFSKFRKQLSKIFTQSFDFRLYSKTSPGDLGVFNLDTLALSDGLPSLCYLTSSSVFELLLKSLFLLLKNFVISISDNSYYLNNVF